MIGSSVEQGDIYWVNPPSATGSEQAGRRPYVIVSRLAVNRAGKTVVAIPLSSKTHKANPSFRIRIPVSEMIRDISCASPLVDSVALCDHIRVLDHSLLRERIGKLSHTAVLAVLLGLEFLFDIR